MLSCTVTENVVLITMRSGLVGRAFGCWPRVLNASASKPASALSWAFYSATINHIQSHSHRLTDISSARTDWKSQNHWTWRLMPWNHRSQDARNTPFPSNTGNATWFHYSFALLDIITIVARVKNVHAKNAYCVIYGKGERCGRTGRHRSGYSELECRVRKAFKYKRRVFRW